MAMGKPAFVSLTYFRALHFRCRRGLRTDLNVLGIIPARGGSKSVPHKNLVPLRGLPLIAYTAAAVRRSATVTRAIVSTDDKKIAGVARELGLEVPFLRPDHLSTDDTPMLPVIQHALKWASNEGRFVPDIVVLLQPTSPLRHASDIDAAIRLFQSQSADTVVSVVEVPHQFTPSSLMELKDGALVPASPQPQALRRQDKPRFYARNGPAILAIRRSVIESGRLYGDKVLPLIMPRERSVDIDDPVDLALAEFWLDRSPE
jgi:CMP-N,N'-diacetyllegionaminic acid synthase